MNKFILFYILFLGIQCIPLSEAAASNPHLQLIRKENEIDSPYNEMDKYKRLSVEHRQKVDGIDLHVSDLVLTKNGTTLHMESSEKGRRNDYVRAMDVQFHLYDEKGKEIPSQEGIGHYGEVTGHYYFNKWFFNSEIMFAPIPEGTKVLTVTPYLMLPTDGGQASYDKDRKSKYSKIDYSKFKDVKFKSFKVTIK